MPGDEACAEWITAPLHRQWTAAISGRLLVSGAFESGLID